jgi:N-acetylglutamate synthase-like GNAT family acetyltransferase
MSDAAAVHRVIAHYAGEGLLLPRTEAEIREHIARFLVLVEKRNGDEKVLGCVALEPYGADLAEIRSLAVAPDSRGQGRNVGDRLMKAAMDTARRRKIARLFAVTHRPEFFTRYGFTPGPRQIVREGERAGKPFSTLPIETLQKFSSLFAPDFYDALKLESALAGPDVEGGTAPARVRDAIAAAKERLAALEKKS